jgi:hypothetical protein
MFQVYVPNVSFVSDVCCKYFHLSVAKVDLEVAIHASCKGIFLSISGVSYVCCKCFIWMLHMFRIVFKCFQEFLQVF